MFITYPAPLRPRWVTGGIFQSGSQHYKPDSPPMANRTGKPLPPLPPPAPIQEHAGRRPTSPSAILG